MIGITMGGASQSATPSQPISTAHLLFDLNCINLPTAALEVELPDGSIAAITGVTVQAPLDKRKPVLTLSTVLVRGPEGAVVEDEPEDLAAILDSYS